uniref:Uncharacterized protein n=1 Tax=Mycena chlorophos TaxID=658473 RepID=A0ABQ0LY62_MYCCL|nr:predicted protein [Mycena chlorophos]
MAILRARPAPASQQAPFTPISPPANTPFLKIKNRAANLTQFFIVPDHPQRRHVKHGTSYVFYTDTRQEAQTRTYEAQKDLRLPGCLTALQARRLGALQLKDGDFIFSRSLQGSMLAEDDVVQVFVSGSKIISRDMVDDMQAAVKAALGDVKDLTPDCPTEVQTTSAAAAATSEPSVPIVGDEEGVEERDEESDSSDLDVQLSTRPRTTKKAKRPARKRRSSDAVLTGGTALERSPLGWPVKEGTRCYTIAATLESPTSLLAPAATSKQSDPKHAPMLAVRKELGRCAANIAATCFSNATSRLYEYCKLVHMLYNVPSIGVKDNFGYATQQANFASVKVGEGASLSGDLGPFGDGHYDGKDLGPAMSNMAIGLDVDLSDCDPGLFFILDLFVFIEMDNDTSINFSGRRRHGGTPAVCRSTGKPVEGYRIVVISYPPQRMLNGTARLNLCPLGKGGVLCITPEMLHVGSKERADEGWDCASECSRATWATEGASMMDTESHFMHYARSIVVLTNYVLQQLPPEYHARLDPDLLLQAMTIRREDGERVSAGAWELAPGFRRKDDCGWNTYQPTEDVIDQAEVRDTAYRNIKQYEDVVSAHIPDVARHGTPSRTAPPPPVIQVLCKNCKKDLKIANKRKKPKIIPKPADLEDAGTGAAEEGEIGADTSGAGESSAGNDNGETNEFGAGSDQAHDDEESEGDEEDTPDELTDEGDDGEEDDDEAEDELAFPLKSKKRPLSSLDRSTAESESNKRQRELQQDQPTWGMSSYNESSTLWTTPSSSTTRSSIRLQSSQISEQWNMDVDGEDDSEEDELLLVPPRGPLFQIPFLNRLTATTIRSNLDEVERAWNALSTSSEVDALRLLDDAYAALLHKPDAISTASIFPGLWSGLRQLKTAEGLNSLRARLDRECIMLTQFFAWRWLCAYCPARIAAALKKGPAPGDWIGYLAIEAKKVVERGHSSHVFAAAAYGLDLGDVSYLHSGQCRRQYFAPTEVESAVVALCIQVLECWLGFPTEDQSRYQAWFIFAIIHGFGRAALLLDETWYAFNRVRREIGDLRSRARDRYSERFALFRQELRQHPLADTSSQEYQDVAFIAEIIGYIRRGGERPSTIMDARDAAALQLPTPASAIQQLNSRVSSLPLPAPRSSNPHPVLLLRDVQLDTLSPAVQKKMESFAHWIREALVVTLDPQSVTAPTKWQAALLRRPDFLQPFRELAPSRTRASGPEGPYTADFAITPSGFASCLGYRAVLFGGKFAESYPLRYPHYAAFKTAKAKAETVYKRSHRQDPSPSFICNPSAYGPANPHRTVELMPIYFERAQKFPISSLLKKKCSIPFTKAWTWLNGTYMDRALGKRVKRFPGLGPLTSYLVAIDYTYTNPRIVDPPSVEELAALICRLNKGAAKGLETLGLIPRRPRNKDDKAGKSTVEACLRGLRIVHAFLGTVIPPELQHPVFFDLAMDEHSLCKFPRSIKNGYWPRVYMEQSLALYIRHLFTRRKKWAPAQKKWALALQDWNERWMAIGINPCRQVWTYKWRVGVRNGASVCGSLLEEPTQAKIDPRRLPSAENSGRIGAMLDFRKDPRPALRKSRGISCSPSNIVPPPKRSLPNTPSVVHKPKKPKVEEDADEDADEDVLEITAPVKAQPSTHLRSAFNARTVSSSALPTPPVSGLGPPISLNTSDPGPSSSHHTMESISHPRLIASPSTRNQRNIARSPAPEQIDVSKLPMEQQIQLAAQFLQRRELDLKERQLNLEERLLPIRMRELRLAELQAGILVNDEEENGGAHVKSKGKERELM